jgi:hypothetical protein
MIALDYAPGLHGHFLEYVINTYIFCTNKVNNIFQSSGAADRLNVIDEYNFSKIVKCGHYTAFNYPWDNTTKQVIFIRHASELDIIFLTNIYYRCHEIATNSYDFDVEKIKKFQSALLSDKNEEWLLKNNWFSKLNERHFDNTLCRPLTDLPIFDFDFRCFFDFKKFVTALQQVSQFLNMTFCYDPSLYILWEEFISKNQGYALYTTSNKILSYAYANRKYKIPNDWQLHAYLNYVLSCNFRLYDGILHSDQQYPTDTCKLYEIIKQHLENFDASF